MVNLYHVTFPPVHPFSGTLFPEVQLTQINWNVNFTKNFSRFFRRN